MLHKLFIYYQFTQEFLHVSQASKHKKSELDGRARAKLFEGRSGSGMAFFPACSPTLPTDSAKAVLAALPRSSEHGRGRQTPA